MPHASSEGMRNEACCYLWTFGYITGTEWSQKHKMQQNVMHLGCFVFKCRWLLWRVDTHTLSWNIMYFHHFGSMSNHQANKLNWAIVDFVAVLDCNCLSKGSSLGHGKLIHGHFISLKCTEITATLGLQSTSCSLSYCTVWPALGSQNIE